jgi:sodium transport system permease protein
MAQPTLLRTAFAVARRELTEALRDVHVLVFSLGFPLLFYPLVLWGGIQLALLEEGLAERNPPRVVAEGPADLVEAVTEPPAEVAAPVDPRAALAAGTVDLVVRGQERGDALAVTALYTSTRPRSGENRGELDLRLDALTEARQAALEQRHDQPAGALGPWEITDTDTAPPGGTLASVLGLAVPMILLTSMMLAGVYPTVEVVVGERERGTLETTMLAASPRGAVVMGKVLAVVGLLLLATVGNALAMGLTLVSVLEQLDPDGDTALALQWLDLLAAAPLLLVTVMLAAAVLTLSALPTRTFRQGQSATSTAATVLMLPALVGTMPALDLSPLTALIPIANTVLVLRDAIGGEGLTAAPLLIALGVNGGLGALVLWVAGRIVGTEGWLLGGQVPRWLRFLAKEDR